MIETLNANRFGKLVNSKIESVVKYPNYHTYTRVDGPVYEYTPHKPTQIMTIALDYPDYNLEFSHEITHQEYCSLWTPYVMNYDIYYNPNDVRFITSEYLNNVLGLKIFGFEFNLTKFVRGKDEKNIL